MVLALPGGVGCLSWLQERIKRTASRRVYLNRQFHDAMDDFRWLTDNISSRPTRIGEIVPEAPTEFGRVDASGQGMGGVWIDNDGGLYDAALDPATLAPDRGHGRGQAVADVAGSAAPAGATPHVTGDLSRDCRSPILWRHRFPADIVEALVSFNNPRGAINNSELELAGHIAHNDVLARERDLTKRTTATGTDNTASHGWATKGAASSSGPSAYLLRLQAMHQRVFRYQQRTFYLPGEANGMADDCSRL